MNDHSRGPGQAARVRTLLLVLAATLCGLWLRATLAFASGLWRDEVQSLEVATLGTVGEMVAFLARDDSHPPLFYLFERAWVALFGQSDAAVVSLGLLPGIALIPVAALIAGQLAGHTSAVLAGWFTAVAWPLVWHSGDARPYSFLSLATLVTAWAAFSAAPSRSPRPWAAYAMGCIVLFYVHSWWALVAASLALLTLYRAWRNSGGDWRGLRGWALTHAVVGAAVLPWIPAMLRQARTAGYAAHASIPFEWPVVALTLLLGVTLPLVIPAIVILGLTRTRPARDGRAGSPAAFMVSAAMGPCILAVLAWPFTDLTVSHCAAAIVSLTMVALAIMLGRHGGGGRRTWRLGGAALFFALLVAAMGSRWFLKSNVREAGRLVAREAAPGDIVLVYPSSIGPAYHRYHRSEARMIVLPGQSRVSPTSFGGWWGRFSDPGVVASVRADVQAVKHAGGSVWLVAQWRRDFDSDSLAPVGSSERFQHDIVARLGELRSLLGSTVGPGRRVLDPRAAGWRRELVGVERYSAGGD